MGQIQEKDVRKIICEIGNEHTNKMLSLCFLHDFASFEIFHTITCFFAGRTRKKRFRKRNKHVHADFSITTPSIKQLIT